MSDELPEGWAETTLGLGLILNIQTGFACGKHSRDGKGVAHLRPMNVSEAGQVVLDDVKYVDPSEVDREERWLRRGDVVFNNTNSPELVGKTGLYEFPEPRAFSNHMTRLRCAETVLDPKFCALTLHHRWRQGYFFEKCNNHVSQASVGRELLLATELRLPPLPEQRRIVEKVEALLEQVNRAKERLDRVPLILKRFRQAVLAAACSGELTNIRDVEVDGPFEFLPSLPRSWRWMAAEEVCSRVVDCHNKTAPYTASGISLLRTTNIRGGQLVLEDLRYVSEETYKFWSRRCPPEAGDILFTREAPMGEAAIIPAGMKVCMGQRMMLLRANEKIVSREYLLLAVQSPYVRTYAEHVAVGSGVLHMRVGDVERLPIPVPPLSVQSDVVRKAKEALSLVGKVEARLRAATSRASKLPQAILSKAFSGELVPTEAELARIEGRTFETAEELLKRVRDGAAQQPPAKARGRRRAEETSTTAARQRGRDRVAPTK